MMPVERERADTTPASAALSGARRLLRYVARTFVEYHSHAPFRIQMIAWLGAVALVGYHFIWTYLFPQPYENLPLRLVGAGFCLALALAADWPQWAKKYYYPFTYILLVFNLPFFFTFMLLMNGLNEVWLMSTLAGLLITALLFDTVNMVLATIVGIALALVAFLIVGDVSTITWDRLQSVPILIFTLATIRVLLNFNDSFVEREKMRAARTLAGHIAHEMRTPLLGIQLDAGKARQYLPALADAVAYAKANGWQGGGLRGNQVDQLGKSMERIGEHAGSAGMIVDMLLFNARHDYVDAQGFVRISMKDAVTKAISRFHFRPGEQARLQAGGLTDFTFLGSEIMMVHVIFNLLRNALKAIEPNPDGAVHIRTVIEGTSGRIEVSDNGKGIPPQILNELFVSFRSDSALGTGSGLGLSYCKLAAESFGGRISARSEPGKGATFILEVPILAEPAAASEPVPGIGKLA